MDGISGKAIPTYTQDIQDSSVTSEQHHASEITQHVSRIENQTSKTELHKRVAGMELPKPINLPQALEQTEDGNLPHNQFIQGLELFCQKAQGIDIPTRSLAQLDLLESLYELTKLSSQYTKGDPLNSAKLKQLFSILNNLYPLFFQTDTQGSFQITELLFDFGLITPKASDMTTYLFSPKWRNLSRMKSLPFKLFNKLYGSFLYSPEFKDAMTSPKNRFDFINMSDPDYLKTWLNCHPYANEEMFLCLCKQDTSASGTRLVTQKLAPSVSLSAFENIFKPACDTAYASSNLIPSDYMSFVEKSLDAHPSEMRPLLRQYLSSFDEDKKQWFLSEVLQSGKVQILIILMEMSFNTASLSQWRDTSGATLLHAKYLKNWENSHLVARCLESLINKTGLTELFSAVDQDGLNALNSYIDSPSLSDAMESPVFDWLLEKSLQSQPKILKSLTIKQRSSLSASDLMVLCKLVQKGVLPEDCFPTQFTIKQPKQKRPCYQIHLNCEQSLKNLFIKHKPLTDLQQQKEFISAVYHLPLDKSIKQALAYALQPCVRSRLLSNPLTDSFYETWKAAVLPLPEKALNYGSGVDVALPWTKVLNELPFYYQQPENEDLLNEWETIVKKPVDIQPLSVLKIEPGNPDYCGIYGRSCYFKTHNSDRIQRLKFRKKQDNGAAEPLDTLVSETSKLSLLRKWQANRTLPLYTRFPEPQGIYKVDNFEKWLDKQPFNQFDKEGLRESVYVEADGSASLYAYTTDVSEKYHLYPYDSGSDLGSQSITKEEALASIKTTAHDLGVLAHHGFAATVLPLYHDLDNNRCFIALAQLAGFKCPGSIPLWNTQATDYPNISPGVGLRDYADINPFRQLATKVGEKTTDTPENLRKSAMEQMAGEFLSLILIMARTLEKDMNYKNPDCIALLEKQIQDLSVEFFSTAYGIQDYKIIDLLKRYNIDNRLALEIAYWCDTSANPDYLKHLHERSLSTSVYPEAFHHHSPASTLLRNTACTALLHGFKDSILTPGVKLGYNNGPFPLLQLNKLTTLMMNCFVYSQAHQIRI